MSLRVYPTNTVTEKIVLEDLRTILAKLEKLESSREVALTKTKIQEAYYWLAHGMLTSD